MGRQEYLARLALGRSAYQDTVLPPLDQTVTTGEENHSSTHTATQEYDSKGRPTSKATMARDAALRRAQNEVLALTGIVERKEEVEAQAESDANLDRVALSYTLRRENERGEELDAVADVLAFLLLRFPDALLARLQAGFCPIDVSFAAFLHVEWMAIPSRGLRTISQSLLPGTSINLAAEALSQLCSSGVEMAISSVQTSLLRLNIRRSTTIRVHDALTFLSSALSVATDALVLPLSYYSITRCLDLTPYTNSYAFLTSTLPLHFRTFHTYAWRSPFEGCPVLLSPLLSPAALLLIYNLTYRNATDEIPAFAVWTSYRHPPISLKLGHESSAWHDKSFIEDPFGVILHACWHVRLRVMRWCGWQLQDAGTQPLLADMNNVNELGEDFHINDITAHRSTALARLPARWLAMRLDGLMMRVLLLPFEALAMRAVAGSFMQSSPLPKTARALRVLAGDVPWRSPGLFAGDQVSWQGLGGNMSKIGLGIAFQAVIEMGLFAGVYGVVRWQGVKNFGWGRRDLKIGH